MSHTPIGTRARIGAWRRRALRRDAFALSDKVLHAFTGGVLGAVFATAWCLILAPALAVWIASFGSGGAPQ